MFEATTILALRHQGKVVIAGDGQVTMGQTVMKHRARKIRRLYHDQILTGFAGLNGRRADPCLKDWRLNWNSSTGI